MPKNTYRVLAIHKDDLGPASKLALWTIDVQQQRVANAPTLTLQVESATQPYALGAVVELCPAWIMAPTPAAP